MTLAEFHNGLRILLNIDMHDLVDAGVLLDTSDWQKFCADPFRWLIRASDADAEKLWTLMQRRIRR